MAAPFISSNSSKVIQSSTTSFPITMPPGCEIGDMVVVCFSILDSGFNLAIGSSSGGIWKILPVKGEDSGKSFWIIYCSALTSANPTLTLSKAGSSGASHVSIRFSAAQNVRWADTPAVAATATTGTPNPPPIIPHGGTGKDTLYLVLGYAISGLTGVPSGYTLVAALSGSGIAYKSIDSSASVDPGTFSGPTGEWNAVTLALVTASVSNSNSAVLFRPNF